ncbi:septal ring lytic transglycosylase RlpA family protein [Leptolyngbya sp. AN02str]|uniref:septal ring lytic transglycosylase RlpA family protein n=1 Tax=Leptolyngbya sp. AN02str TaxID=3423363 RepID=UPI003D31A605
MNSFGLAWSVVYLGSFLSTHSPLAHLPSAASVDTWESRISSPTLMQPAAVWQVRRDSAAPHLLTQLEGLIVRLSPWAQQRRSSFTPPVVMVVQARPDSGADSEAVKDGPIKSLLHCKAEQRARASFAHHYHAPHYQVWVRDRLIADLPTQAEANQMAQSIRQVVQSADFDPSTLRPARVRGLAAMRAENEILFVVNRHLARHYQRSGDVIAIDWVNNLRRALGASALSLVQGQAQLDNLVASDFTFEGKASWYGPYFHRRLSANGERFDQHALTAAHKTLPFNTYLKVTNLKNQRSVVVRINDRGPYVGDRSLDLSLTAARCIGGETAGLVTYRAEVMSLGSPSSEALVATTQLFRPLRSLSTARVAGQVFPWSDR